MKKIIWLDQSKDPKLDYRINLLHNDHDIIWLQSYKSFVTYINKCKLPDKIYFGTIDSEKTEYDCIKYLTQLCINLKLKLPKWHCFGKDNNRIEKNTKLLKQFIKQ